MARALFNAITLWLGMYGISVTLLYIKTENIRSALIFALLGSTLKMVWSHAHTKLTCRMKRTSHANS